MTHPIRPFRSLFVTSARKTTVPRGGVFWARRLLGGVGRVWRTLSLWVGGAVLAVLLLSVLWGAVSPTAPLPSMPARGVLSIVLDQPLSDEPVPALMAFGQNDGVYDVRTLAQILDRAAQDSRIQAVVIETPVSGLVSVTALEALAPSLTALSQAGKKTAYIAPDIDGLVDYALASTMQSIWLSPVGTIEMAGLSMEQPFAGALLDRLGIAPAIFQRKEYKTAYENLVNDRISAPNRTMTQSILKDIGDRLVAMIAAGRAVEPARVQQWMAEALWSDDRALAAGLIDHQGMRADLENAWSDLFDNDVEWIDAVDYAQWMREHPPVPFGKSRVALIPVRGVIVNAAETDGWGGDDAYGADAIADAISQAADDPSIKAIIISISSPGGVPSAAEMIAASIDRARAAYPDKPVFVSMGDVAASGGYWVAAAGERIYAYPSTLTGSIGVVGGKFVFDKASRNLSIAWDAVDYGAEAGLTSPFRAYSPRQTMVMNRMIDDIYAAFIDRVAAGRSLTPQQVEILAKGRVWTGQQALERGLVDQIGGIDTILDDLAKRLGKRDRYHLELVKMPPDPTPFERLAILLEMGGGVHAHVRAWLAPLQAMTHSPVLLYDPVVSGSLR